MARMMWLAWLSCLHGPPNLRSDARGIRCFMVSQACTILRGRNLNRSHKPSASIRRVHEPRLTPPQRAKIARWEPRLLAGFTIVELISLAFMRPVVGKLLLILARKASETRRITFVY